MPKGVMPWLAQLVFGDEGGGSAQSGGGDRPPLMKQETGLTTD